MTFRKKIYNSLEDLQIDVNQWLIKYNQYRPHSGRSCYGKTPTQTFLDAKHLAKEKNLDKIYLNEITNTRVSSTIANRIENFHDTQSGRNNSKLDVSDRQFIV